MSGVVLNTKEQETIDACVAKFAASKYLLENLARNFNNDLAHHPALKEFIHSTKTRIKSETSLRRKLRDKALKARGDSSLKPVEPNSLFEQIGDLAGVRVLHLYTEQIEQIHPAIMQILDEAKYLLVEAPFANTWDEEYKAYYEKLGIKVETRESMYTSIHYVVRSNGSSDVRCELQVRTLMEEVWGETSHQINYPEATPIDGCRRQLKVLARVVSTGLRLVDSIIALRNEHKAKKPAAMQPKVVMPPQGPAAAAGGAANVEVVEQPRVIPQGTDKPSSNAGAKAI